MGQAKLQTKIIKCGLIMIENVILRIIELVELWISSCGIRHTNRLVTIGRGPN